MASKKEKNQATTQTTPAKVEAAPSRPVVEVKIPMGGGILIGSAWRHERDQKSWYSISLSRGYKESPDSDWQYSQAFSRDELAAMLLVIPTLHQRIVEHANGGSHD